MRHPPMVPTAHRVRFALLASALAASPALAQAQPAPAGCAVAALVGTARADDQALSVGSPLAAGMTLQTGPQSRLRLRCSDGSSLVMAADTRLRLEVMGLSGNQRQELRWHLALGLIGQKVSPGGRWTVRTPSAVTAVRGTEFTVEVNEATHTAVLMQQGSVEVQPAPPASRNALGGLSGALGGSAALVALAALQGTDCSAGRCTPAAVWGAPRVQQTLDRLAGI